MNTQSPPKPNGHTTAAPSTDRADHKPPIADLTADGWQNITTQLGMDRDKRQSGYMATPAYTITEDYWADIYHGDDLAATIAEVPAREMVREWIDLRSDMSEDAIKATLQSLDDLDAQSQIYKALVWSRVFGGAVVFIGANDGTSSLAQPLREDRVRSVDYLQVWHRFQLEIQQYDTDPRSRRFGEPLLYALRPSETAAVGGVGGSVGAAPYLIHASRVLRFDGAMTTPRRMRANGGWCDSIFVRVETLLRDYGLAWGSIAHLMQDAAQAVYKIRGLADALASDGDALVLQRLATLDRCRSVSRAIPLDAEHEDFTRQVTPVDGLDGLLDRFALRLSAAARMPATLLFGQSPGGLNATGDADIRFFYDTIASQQQSVLRPAINRLVSLLFAAREGPTQGRAPDNWSIEFRPLWQLTDKESAQLRRTQADADQMYIGAGVLTPAEVAQSRFGGDRYSTEQTLDPSVDRTAVRPPEKDMPLPDRAY